ncbi:MAG: hypothetical protein MJ010_01650 [Paludibacteraceae bacterium]|nr:hypothetical protein [Paludibacteraceae bacterium]
MEEKIKHLEFIQNVITRMNTNSFQLKGWMITIVSALLALYANSENVLYIFVAIAPVIIFWCLDAFYLKQEKLYRKLYQEIVNNNNVTLFDMNASKYEVCYCKVFWSKTIAGLYCTIAVLLILLGLFLKYQGCCIICNC